jgi:hypothetical protein
MYYDVALILQRSTSFLVPERKRGNANFVASFYLFYLSFFFFYLVYVVYTPHVASIHGQVKHPILSVVSRHQRRRRRRKLKIVMTIVHHLSV